MTEQMIHRLDELFILEMHFNGSSYIGKKEYNSDFNVHHTEIQFDSEEEWEIKISKLKESLKERKLL